MQDFVVESAVQLPGSVSLGYARTGEAAGKYILFFPLAIVTKLGPLWEVVITDPGRAEEDDILTIGSESLEAIEYLDSLMIDFAPDPLIGVLGPVLFPGVDFGPLSGNPPPSNGRKVESNSRSLNSWWRSVLNRAEVRDDS